MDELFKKWFKKKYKADISDVRALGWLFPVTDLQLAWQESRKQAVAEDKQWHDIIKECEQLLGCPDTAESPLMCNLVNLVRDLKNCKRHTRETIEESNAVERLIGFREGMSKGIAGERERIVGMIRAKKKSSWTIISDCR